MERFIAYEKPSKKEKRKADSRRRKTWGSLNPITRKRPNRKRYNRKKNQYRKDDLYGADFLLFYKEFSAFSQKMIKIYTRFFVNIAVENFIDVWYNKSNQTHIGGLMMKKTLIVVDMQNDFIDMVLGTKEAVAIVPKVKAKIQEYTQNGDEIIFTRDTHFENYLDTTEGKHLPVPHCIKGTKGWEIADGLYVEGAKIIDKPNFGWPHWDEEMLESVELIGLCTDICVVSNALIIKAQFPDAQVKVDSACCAGVTPESHQAALKTMQMCQVDVV